MGTVKLSREQLRSLIREALADEAGGLAEELAPFLAVAVDHAITSRSELGKKAAKLATVQLGDENVSRPVRYEDVEPFAAEIVEAALEDHGLRATLQRCAAYMLNDLMEPR